MNPENDSQQNNHQVSTSGADVIAFAPVGSAESSAGSHRFGGLTASIVFAGAVLVGIGVWLLTAPGETTDAPVSVFTMAQTRTLAMRVVGRGTVQPARVVSIKSPIESNRARIVWLLPEGERVAAGELVARFDRRPFVEALELAEARRREADAQVVRAEKALALAAEDSAGKAESAARQVEVAMIDVENVRKGGGRIELRRLQAAVDKAKRTLRIARVEGEDYVSLFEQGHVSRKELEVAEDAVKNAEDTLGLAKEELAGYQRYEWPRQIRETDLKLDAARAEFDRVQRTAQLDRQRLEADLAQATQDASVAAQMVAVTQAELANVEVRAPIAGTLLHREVPRQDDKRKVQVGDAVWLGQTFLEIPDTSDLQVHLLVRELDVAKLAPGMAALVELDAFVGDNWSGVVTRVANMAAADNGGPRQFLVEVRFNKSPPGAHVGMSANVGIIHDQVEAELAVPVDAVSYRAGVASVRVDAGGGAWQRRTITPGASDGDWVQVLEGLKAGERIALR